uniref:UbiA family prenyltransferase n=2 Tax=unclassified Frankia TaxID=2632575 RepID=UPI001EF64D0C
MRALRLAALKTEAAWWMTRIHLSNMNIWPVFMGWAVADPSPDPWPLVWLAGYVAAAGGALFIVNDILDADGDQITAPYLPLPSGLLTVREAWAAAAGYFAVALGALFIACGGVARTGLALALTIAAVVFSMAYSTVKDEGVVASFVVSVPQTIPAVVGWYLAGGQHPWWLVGVLAYLLIACVSNNILAALRDVDLDPVVGNMTVPVRIGATRAFQLAARVATLAFVPIVILAAVVPGGWWGLAVAAPAALIMSFCYRRTLAAFGEPGRGRLRRMADMRLFKFGEYVRHTALAAVFSVPVALSAGVVMQATLYFGGFVYALRVIRGGIRRDLAMAGAATDSPAGAATDSPAGAATDSPAGAVTD